MAVPEGDTLSGEVCTKSSSSLHIFVISSPILYPHRHPSLFTELAEKRPEEYRAHVTPNLILDLLSSSVYTSGDRGDLVRLVAEMIRLLKAASSAADTEQLRSVCNVTRNKVRR